ncbi:glycosyltransferase family 4 protein [Synechococcus sp. BS55D]|uniref:glycosyltransferase family 4 protein n=1 Tax=Synechococcus sp. BS55D TaxID=2055943 RepID=UPI00103B78F2|nr:glycosyltransferase family 4 protein [Synechococcus sp. BS55D]TCD58119.1 hypothetical protein CWE16_02120 [Synechococcus sp. BS55D]
MRMLLITNLYPPQELGGYGRCMADFCWGLMRRGHQVQVLCNDASYLGAAAEIGPSGEPVARQLLLRGDFCNGVHLIRDAAQLQCIEKANREVIHQWLENGRWDGILLGNLDLLGVELLHWILEKGSPVLHHVGFVHPPYPIDHQPRTSRYVLLAASAAVRSNLCKEGINAAEAPIIYPGARTDRFGPGTTDRLLPETPCQRANKPLHLCFAGLLMESKGPHTLLEAIVLLHQKGYPIRASLAGGHFQKSYVEAMQVYCADNNIDHFITFHKQLSRDQLARFFRLHHAAVFPSIHPEAFGIVAVEAMASGLALLSSAVGGAAEVFEHNTSGLGFEAGNPNSLAAQIERLFKEPGLLRMLQENGMERARNRLDVGRSARQIEAIISQIATASEHSGIQHF